MRSKFIKRLMLGGDGLMCGAAVNRIIQSKLIYGEAATSIADKYLTNKFSATLWQPCFFK